MKNCCNCKKNIIFAKNFNRITMKKVLMNLALCAVAMFGAMSVSAQEEKSPCETQCNVGLEIKSSEI